MPALQALTGGKLLFSPCDPFSAADAYSGAAAPSSALSRRVVGLCPTPHFLLCQKEAKSIFRALRGSRRRAYPPDKFQFNEKTRSTKLHCAKIKLSIMYRKEKRYYSFTDPATRLL